MKKRSFNNKGFSLIELLVVIAIIGILAAVGVPVYIGYVSSAQKTDAQNNLQGIYMVQEEYKASNALNNYYTTSTGTTCNPASRNDSNVSPSFS